MPNKYVDPAIFPVYIFHEKNPALPKLLDIAGNHAAIFTSPTINGELTMQNKIRVHPKQLKRMLTDPFWAKMYENDPDKFEVTDTPADDKEDTDEEEV